MKQLTLLGSAILSATAPLLCCWGPALLTGIAGISGSASLFFWVHPLRPVLYGIAFISLTLAFYNAYRPVKISSGSCPNCLKKENTPFLKSKLYVWMVSAFVVFMFLNSYFLFLF